MLNHFSCVWPFVTPWTVACQAPLSMRFSRQEYWSGLPWLPPGDLPDPGIEPASLLPPTLAEGSLASVGKPPSSAKEYYSVQFSSVTQSCPTLCDPMNHSTPGLPVHHQLLEFTQTHVRRVGDAIQSPPRSPPKPMSIESVMPSSHLILCRPLLLLPSIFPIIRVFSNESALRIRWPKYLDAIKQDELGKVEFIASGKGCEVRGNWEGGRG